MSLQEQYLFNLLMDSHPDYIYFKDLSGRFIKTSKSLAAYFRVDDPADLVGKTDFDFFDEEPVRRAYEDKHTNAQLNNYQVLAQRFRHQLARHTRIFRIVCSLINRRIQLRPLKLYGVA